MATQKWPGSAAKMQRRRGKNAGKMWKTGKKMGTPLELFVKNWGKERRKLGANEESQQNGEKTKHIEGTN
jgi:hypothetical protein